MRLSLPLSVSLSPPPLSLTHTRSLFVRAAQNAHRHAYLWQLNGVLLQPRPEEARQDIDVNRLCCKVQSRPSRRFTTRRRKHLMQSPAVGKVFDHDRALAQILLSKPRPQQLRRSHLSASHPQSATYWPHRSHPRRKGVRTHAWLERACRAN